MIVVPYRVKNPPKRFPMATVTLIALNVIVFLLTSRSFLVIRREIVEEFGLVWGASPPITIFTSMFLHGDIFHLVGNMLFLWVFGPAVEDRLGTAYLGVYFVAGFAGDVAEAGLGVMGMLSEPVPMIGASACIMGVLGAYWYMYSWSPVRIFYWITWFWRGTFELAAIWVIGSYFALDLVHGLMSRSAGAVGGVANFAHVGGSLAGALLVWAVGVKRDSSEVSRAKATRAEYGDVSLLRLNDLWTLVQGSPDDKDLLVSYAMRAMTEGGPDAVRLALEKDSRTIITLCPEVAVYSLINFRGFHSLLAPADLVYLGRWCEDGKRTDQALMVYGMLEDNYPEASELEMALYRQAEIRWRWKHDRATALGKLDLLFSRFPNGFLALDAQDLRDEIAEDRNLNAA